LIKSFYYFFLDEKVTKKSRFNEKCKKAHIIKPLQRADSMTPIMMLKFATQAHRQSSKGVCYFSTYLCEQIFGPAFSKKGGI
jgi:hypothetical protein